MGLTPCGSCPWRVGATADRIPAFDRERALCSLPSTVGPDDAFRPIMACHLSTEDANEPCVGYLVTDEAWANLGVRWAVTIGQIDLAGMMEACRKLELYPTFDEMLANITAEPSP